MKICKLTLFMLIALLNVQTAQSAGAETDIKDQVRYLTVNLQMKHFDTEKFMFRLKELLKSDAGRQYLELKLMDMLAKNPAAGSRMRAAWLLGEIKSKRSVPLLVKAKKDKHRWVRTAAEQALMEIQKGSQ